MLLTRSSLSTRIVSYFAALFLLTIGMLLAAWYIGVPQLGLTGASEQRVAAAMQLLEIKADLQRALIVEGIKDRRGDILVIAESKSLSQQLANRDPAVQQHIERLFDRLQRAYPDRYQHLLVVDPATGLIRASEIPGDIGHVYHDQALVKHAAQAGAIEIVTQLKTSDGLPGLAIVRQIYGTDKDGYQNGKLVGILIACIDLQNFIAEGLQEEMPGTNMHRSTLLFGPDGQILARFPPLYGAKESFSLSKQAINGSEGTLQQTDEKKNALIVVYRHLQLSGTQAWTLVHYSRKDEVLGGLKESATTLIAAVAFITLLGLLLITLAARRLTLPLASLAASANQLGAGKLSVRAVTSQSQSREIAVLSAAFNTMAQDIQKVHNTLEAKVRERTKELQISELRHRTLFATAPDALLVLKSDEVIDCNPAALTMFGVQKHEDFIGRHFLELLPAAQINDEDSQIFAQRQLHMSSQNGSASYECLHHRLDDGKCFFAEVLLNRLVMDEQTYIQATIRDISARKLAQEQLRQSEQNLSITLESIGDAVIATDAAGRITRMNRTAEQLTGWTLAEATGLLLPQVFHIVNADSRQEVSNPVQLVMQRGDVVGLANHTALLARDGHEYQIADSAAPIRDRSGQIVGVVLVFSDVSEDYRIRASFESTAAMLARTGEIAKIGGWELDIASMTLFWSSETFRIHEVDPPVTPSLEQGLNFFTPEARPVIRAAVTAAIEYGTPYDLELPKLTSTGRLIWVRTQGAAVMKDGKVVKLVGAFHDITERKRVQAALEESEERNRSLVEWSPEPILVHRHETIIYVNPAAVKLFGADSATDLVGRPLLDIVAPETHELMLERIQQMRRHSFVAPLTGLKNRKLDGTEIDVEVKATKISFNGEAAIYVVIHDVSASKRAEKALRESQAKLQATLDAIPDILFEVDLDGRYLSYHSPRSELLIAPPQDLLGHLVSDVMPGDAADIVMASLREANESGYSCGKQILLNLPQGTMWFELSAARKQRFSDEAPSFIVLSRNITERKLSNQALQDSEERHRAMVEWSPEAIIIHRTGKILYVNPAAIRLFGAPSALDLVGTSILDRIHPDFHQLAHARGKTIADHGVSTAMIEEVLLKLDGSAIVAEVQSTSIYYDGQLAFHTFVHDITKRKRTQAALQESEERHRALVEWSPEGIYVHRNGVLIYVNPATIKMLGAHSAQDLVGKPILEIVHPDFHSLIQTRLQNILEHGSHAPMAEMKFFRLDGVTIDIQAQATPIVFDGVPAIYVAWNDISDRKKNEEAQRIAATAFESQEGILVTDAASIILRVNKAFSQITGYSAEDAIGKTPRLLSSGRHDAMFFTTMRDHIQNIGSWQGEIWNRRKSGEIFPGWMTITAVKNDLGNTTHFVGTFTDITSRKTAENEIKNLAFYDPLTSLPNRRLLLDRLEQALAARSRHQRKGALLFVDLDNFKTLNDTLGHDKGDLLLQQVAQRLSTCTRDGDTVARLGGDEFVVMLEDLSENTLEAANQAEAVGEKILTALNQSYQLAHYEHHSTPSIGVTLFGEQQESIDEPLKRADLAMYQAKAAGRNTLRFFDPQMQAVVTARALLEEGLREAVAKQQFVLHYQAQVTGEGRLTGAEALVRWMHPQRGMVSPAEFISLAEETALILPLGRYVLDMACKQLASWSEQPDMHHLTLAVNVSPRQFYQRDFVEQVLQALASSGAQAERLKLELTESLLVSNVDDVIAKMRTLKAKGVGFSLDDFGTGYSSLAYLKQLPLDQLKIDQSFVRDILLDPNDAAIARMVIVLADSLGLGVIAEGVETQEQRDYLASQGCHAYQGYLFSRPLPLKEFEDFVRRT